MRAAGWVLAVCVLQLGAGCHDVQPPNRVGRERSEIPACECSLEMPPGWSWVPTQPAWGLPRLFSSPSHRLVACRHGVGIAEIEVAWFPLEQAIPSVDRDPAHVLDPDALAEWSLADTKARAANEGSGPVEIVETHSAAFAGEPGFLTHTRIPGLVGPSYDQLQAGFVHGGNVVRISYRAPSLHYFAEECAAFDRVVASLELH